jgi:hypothetical protein
MTHTPGPWLLTPSGTVYALDETGSCNRFSARVDGGWTWRGTGMFSGACSDRTSNAEIAANARLIAAAPELLEALSWFINDIDGTHTRMVDFDANVELARAAIAKARGNPA